MKIITPSLTWGQISIDVDKDMNGKSLTNLNEVIANKVIAINPKYDLDMDGVLGVTDIPDLPRSKITDFFNSPFWDNVPDKPSILSDTVPSQEVTMAQGETITLYNVSGGGIAKIRASAGSGDSGFKVRVYVDTVLQYVYDYDQSWEQVIIFGTELKINYYSTGLGTRTSNTPSLEIKKLIL